MIATIADLIGPRFLPVPARLPAGFIIHYRKSGASSHKFEDVANLAEAAAGKL
jgi:hypothetical protein